MQSGSDKFAIAAVAVTATAATLCFWYYRDDIYFALFALSGDRNSYASLIKIEKAISLVESTFQQLKIKTGTPEFSKSFAYSKEVSRELQQLSLDADFLFSKIDAISGDGCIKAKRKILVERLRIVADQVDKILTERAGDSEL
jgi:hypothetical protein